MSEQRKTSVQTSSPGAPLSPKRQQRTMISYRCRMQEKCSERRAWKSGKSDTPREARVKLPNASFPEWNRILRQTEMTSEMAQTSTEHGGVAQYLHKLKDSSYCACDPSKIQDAPYILE
ncbi:hypothetical protein EVAR_68640_1 [Eumeta japonica]|uniref:Uncharacterized protein n=1 Tax=Eumeta variegata TaxID=151549 RepID=A0A4C2A2B8_EUMVA|nr:hypothetical protein EVAR_68640_1 [Eumeta japonica]